MTISLIYYRFIVRLTIGLEFLFMLFLLQFFLAQMSSLSISSSVTYSSTCSSHIYIYNISIFEHCYASRVCIKSIAVVMDVVPREARSGMPSELLYADDLVLMAPIMKPRYSGVRGNLSFYINFYKNCVHLYNNKICALLQNVCSITKCVYTIFLNILAKSFLYFAPPISKCFLCACY